jgi:hypothetical protein
MSKYTYYEIWEDIEENSESILFSPETWNTEELYYLGTHTVDDRPMICTASFRAKSWREAKHLSAVILGHTEKSSHKYCDCFEEKS